MTEYCRNCGEKLKDNALFCPNCGEKIPSKSKFNYKVLILIIVIILIVGVLAFGLSSQTQIVKVDNVEFEIPSDYVSEPDRTEISFDDNVKSSAMGWSNDKYYIEIGITQTPGKGMYGDEVAASVGGTPTKMFGYSGYYNNYDEEGCSFVFGMKDKVCMIYVSDYDAFRDVKVIDPEK